MTATIYGDFNCPFSYLASRRADLLPDTVDWRAVEHRRELPATGKRLNPAERDALAAEWESVGELLLPGEVLPGQPPAFAPNTQAAVAGYAEAVEAGVGHRVRRLLFRAYWIDGADIGNAEVLRTLLAPAMRSGHSTSEPIRESGYAVSVARGPITHGGYRRIRDWRDGWRALGDATIPALVDGDRAVTGVPALTELGDRVRDLVQHRPQEMALVAPPPSTRYWY
jgi:hypothetical protein